MSSLGIVAICLITVIGIYFYNNPLKHGPWFLSRRFINWFPGEGTVNGGSLDLGGQVLHAGEQAFIFPGSPGQPNIVQIGKIPPGDFPALEALSERAYAARKTVFFSTDASDDITVFPVVPESLPVQATVSPSQLPH